MGFSPGAQGMPGMNMPLYAYNMPRPGCPMRMDMPPSVGGDTVNMGAGPPASPPAGSPSALLGGDMSGHPQLNMLQMPYSGPFGHMLMPSAPGAVPPYPGTMNPGNAGSLGGVPTIAGPKFALSMPPPGGEESAGGARVRGGKGKPVGRPRKYPLEHVEQRFHPYCADDLDGSRGGARKKESGRQPHLKSRLKPPKQSPSAWQIYFTEELHKMKAESPDERLNVARVAKDAGQRYASLPEEERQQYVVRSHEAKEAYEKELAEWRAKLTPDDIKQENMFRSAQRKLGKSRRSNLKDPNAPKKPLSAYFLFLRTIRTDPQLAKEVLDGEHETTKQSVLAAAKWRTLAQSEKQPYLDQADRDKANYEQLRREYEASRGIVRTEAGVSEPSGDLSAAVPGARDGHEDTGGSDDAQDDILHNEGGHVQSQDFQSLVLSDSEDPAQYLDEVKSLADLPEP
ncbi:hypothetical protein MSPP1_001785 [Malassezia sp. CBS 17886]|nr:hypothetical protein MSPP1_001785 [Malassezia sp. CBS 17886]